MTTIDTAENDLLFAIITSQNFGFKGINYTIPDNFLTNEEYREVHGDVHVCLHTYFEEVEVGVMLEVCEDCHEAQQSDTRWMCDEYVRLSTGEVA